MGLAQPEGKDAAVAVEAELLQAAGTTRTLKLAEAEDCRAAETVYAGG